LLQFSIFSASLQRNAVSVESSVNGGEKVFFLKWFRQEFNGACPYRPNCIRDVCIRGNEDDRDLDSNALQRLLKL